MLFLSLQDWVTDWNIQNVNTGFLKLVSLTAKTSNTLFGPIKPTNPSVLTAFNGQGSFGITAILYTYQVCKTLFGLIKPTNPLVLQRPEQFQKACQNIVKYQNYTYSNDTRGIGWWIPYIRVPSGTWKPGKPGDFNIISPGLEIYDQV